MTSEEMVSRGMVSRGPVSSVAVVMPARDAAGSIAAQLDALAAQDEPPGCSWEIVVLDNGSVDRTAAIAAAHPGHVGRLRVVHDDGGTGVNYARNAGVAATDADVVLLCDADDVVQPGWLAAMVDGLSRYDAVGGPLDLVSIGPAPEATSRVSGGALITNTGFLPYPPGGNCGFHRQVWVALGGFDPSYMRGGNEVEFFWRAQLAGFTLGGVADAVMSVRHRAEGRAVFRQRYWWGVEQAHLYRDFAAAGMPRRSMRTLAHAWVRTLQQVPRAWGSAEVRSGLAAQLGWELGLVAGSIRHRVWYP